MNLSMWQQGWYRGAEKCESPNFGQRPQAAQRKTGNGELFGQLAQQAIERFGDDLLRAAIANGAGKAQHQMAFAVETQGEPVCSLA